MSELVKVEDHGAVRHVIMNRPQKRNALNEELVLRLAEAFTHAADDDSVRCLLLRGDGPVFSSGIDLSTLNDLAENPKLLRPFRRVILGAWNLLEQMKKPTVCQIQGACIGGPMELALACDLRTMADEAVIGIPEVKLGAIPDVGGCSRLPAVVGVGRAKELIMTGRLVSANEARQMGLVNRTAPEAELSETTQVLIDELMSCGPQAVGLAKGVIDTAAKPAIAATLEAEVNAQQLLVESEDFAQAVKAFLEKRQPTFAGK